MPAHLIERVQPRPDDWLLGGGEMGKLIRSIDWTRTPLGAIDSWPQSLRTTVSLCLASNFPISLAWGPQHIQIYNDGYWPICGGKHPDALGQDFSECWASAWPVIGDAFERACAGETSYLENQRMFLDRNGYLEETFFTFSFSPIRDETGGVGGLFHPVTETTATMLSERRVRALRDLAARTAKAQTVQEAYERSAQTLAEHVLDLPFALFYRVDSSGKTAELFSAVGLPEGVATPKTVDLKAGGDAIWPLAEVARSGESRHVRNLEGRLQDGWCSAYPEAPKEALVLPVKLPGSERPSAMLVAGVSSRLPLNEAYRAFYDLLAATITAGVANAGAYEEERRRAEALAEIDRAKTAFFSNVSHEFRTPLTLMLGPLEDELAERNDPLPAARRERLEAAHRNSLRLLKLVNSMLDFSRIEAGRVQATYQPTDLAAFTAELASVFRSATEKAGLVLTVDCPSLPEPMYVDREMWEKIVLNLVSNAFKHTFEGEIRVSLQWQRDHAELKVADSGIGIPASELPEVFERFNRVKGARSRSHEGTGIGLALVQELIRLHGGTVSVESEEGKGSTFSVTVKSGTGHLPSERIRLTDAPVSGTAHANAYVEEVLHWLLNSAPTAGRENLDENQEISGSSDHFVSRSSRPRILLADDNADMRNYVGRLLADSYDVVAVQDGLSALKVALDSPPDLILSDIMMPGLDGFGLLKEIRGDSRTRAIPIILLSARAGEESALEGLEAGADDYLTKPFSARELLGRVQTHLELARVRRRWAKEVEQAKLQQLEKFEAIGQLAGGIAHDFNNVIGAILGWAEMGFEESDVESPARKYFDHIRNQSERAAGLTRQLLAYARRQRLESRNLDLNALVSESLPLLQTAVGEHIETKLVLAPDLPKTKADPTQIQQVLMNLCVNARDAMPDGGQLLIETKSVDLDESYCQQHAGARSGRYVQLSVSDTGVGMDAQTTKRIFEPFFTTKEVGKGTGLGLATTFGIVKQHQGHIEVYSEVGRGSRFQIYFPACEGVVEPAHATEDIVSRGGSETILIADDHQGLREMSRQILERRGYHTVLAVDGADAIEQFIKNRERISLVILDVVMPKRSGPDAYQEICAIAPGVRVIFTSGYSPQSSLLESLVASGAAILQKPYSPNVLAGKVREILDRPKS